METHVRNYFKAFGYDQSDTILCEACGKVGVDIHHVEPRSKFGKKRKSDQDAVGNLVCLCRACHDDAHGPNSREVKEVLKRIIAKR